MLYLLLAVAICLLVPWVSVLICRSLPRRPPLPPGAEHLQRLVAELPQLASQDILTGAVVENDQPSTDVSPRPGARPQAPRNDPEKRANTTEQHGPIITSRLAPATKTEGPVRLTLPSYYWINLFLALFFFLAFLGVGFAWAMVFNYLGEAHAQTLLPAVFLFRPDNYAALFWLPEMFLGFISAAPLLGLLAYVLLGRRRFLEYLSYDEGRLKHMGLNSDEKFRVLSFIGLICGILSAIFIVLGMNWYTRLTENEIAIKRIFAFSEEVHPYSSVEEIVVSHHCWKNKEIVPGVDLGIRFQDGRTCTTGESYWIHHQAADLDRIIAFLSRKTGKPILRVRLLKDVPGY
jgi:hypothetical protein